MIEETKIGIVFMIMSSATSPVLFASLKLKSCLYIEGWNSLSLVTWQEASMSSIKIWNGQMAAEGLGFCQKKSLVKAIPSFLRNSTLGFLVDFLLQ